MTSWTIGRVRASGEAYLRELGHARVLALRGRAAPAPAEIRERYAYDLGREALDVVLEQADLSGPETADARSGRVLLGWLAELEVQRACAPLDDWIARWTTSAVARTADGRAVPLTEVDRVIGREPARTARLHLDTARAELIERDLLPTARERAARARDTMESIGIGDSMLDVAARITGTDSTAVVTLARDALARTADVWRDSLAERLHRQGSISIEEAKPADLAAATSLGEFEGAFPRSMRSLTLRRLVAEIGLDPDAGGRLHIEPALAPAASSVEAVPIGIPREVHLVLGPDDGFDAYRRALRALGGALRLAHVQEDAPFEHRWLCDPAAYEIGGLTLGLVLIDAEWLMRYAGITRGEAETVVRRGALATLHEIRHALASMIFHVETIDAGFTAGAIEEQYVEILGAALSVRPWRADAVLRAPSLLHPYSRVQAWQGASVLRDDLTERFDVDWYRNPRTGPWLVHRVLGPACGELAPEVVKGATERELTLSPILAHLERLLA